MSANKITQKFLSLYKRKEYHEVLIYLESFSFITFENLLHYCFTNPAFEVNRAGFAKFFFEEYLPQSKYFLQLCQSYKRTVLFSKIFEYENLQCMAFYKKIADEVPEIFIEFIKRNRNAFLHKEQFVEQIVPQANTDRLIDFIKKNKALAVFEMLYYLDASNEIKKLEGKSLEEIFSLIGLWLYYYTWENSIKKMPHDIIVMLEGNAIYAMDKMLTLIFCNRIFDKSIDFDAIAFQRYVISESFEKPPLYEIFLAWNKWNNFITTVVEPFCFIDKSDFEITPDREILTIIDPLFIQGLMNNIKKHQSYTKLKGLSGDKLNFDIKLTVAQTELLKMMTPVILNDSRELVDLLVTEIYNKKFGIDLTLVTSFLRKQWLFNLINFNEITHNGIKRCFNWKQILQEVDATDKFFLKNQFPFSNPIYDLIKGNDNPEITKLSKIKPGDFEKCLEIITLDIESIEFKEYNRFQSQFNLSHFFWFKLKNKYYCFPQLTDSINVNSFVSNLALKVHKHNNVSEYKKATNYMEQFISDFAKKAGLIAESNFKFGFKIDKKSEEYFSGEIDAVLYDHNRILGIELKRSALRNSLEEVCYEREVILNSAAVQLDNFIKSLQYKKGKLNSHLKIENTIDLSKLSIDGLIVSTNFEFDHENINGYLKISLVEFMWILDTLKPDEGINEILEKIHNNDYWKLKMAN